MAAISSAWQDNKVEDDRAYQPSRKAPPIPALAYNQTVASRPPEQGERPIYQSNTISIRQQQVAAQSLSSRPSTQQTSISQPSQAGPRGRQQQPPSASPSAPAFIPQQQQQQKKRSNSFSFLRRSSSTQPTTRVAQVQAGAPGHQSQSSDGSINSSSIFRARSRDGKAERNMLRKQSKLKQQQEELERQRRAAEAATRPAPRLPETERLPYIESFGGDAPANIPGGAANFSRPSAASNSSYTRTSATSPPVANANGGDYYEPSGERSSSMTNRGRYSYASSTAQVGGNVNSPRRVRRRKDPTPFK